MAGHVLSLAGLIETAEASSVFACVLSARYLDLLTAPLSISLVQFVELSRVLTSILM